MAIAAWSDSALTLNEVCVKSSRKPTSPFIASARCFASILPRDRLRILLVLKGPIYQPSNRFSRFATVKAFISRPHNLRLVFFVWPTLRRILIGPWGLWPTLFRRLAERPVVQDKTAICLPSFLNLPFSGTSLPF